jgi:hypothetical protein
MQSSVCLISFRYPKDNEKEMLAERSGLSRSQVHFLAFSTHTI